MVHRFYREFKGAADFIGFYSLPKASVLVLDLDLARTMLVTDFEVFNSRAFYVNERDDPISAHLISMSGPKWRKLRTKLSPTFTSGKLKGMFPIMVQISENFAKSVEGIVRENPGGFNGFTTDVIGNCAFGIECNSLEDPNNKFRTMGDKIFNGPLGGRWPRCSS